MAATLRPEYILTPGDASPPYSLTQFQLQIQRDFFNAKPAKPTTPTPSIIRLRLEGSGVGDGTDSSFIVLVTSLSGSYPPVTAFASSRKKSEIENPDSEPPLTVHIIEPSIVPLLMLVKLTVSAGVPRVFVNVEVGDWNKF